MVNNTKKKNKQYIKLVLYFKSFLRQLKMKKHFYNQDIIIERSEEDDESEYNKDRDLILKNDLRKKNRIDMLFEEDSKIQPTESKILETIKPNEFNKGSSSKKPKKIQLVNQEKSKQSKAENDFFLHVENTKVL